MPKVFSDTQEHIGKITDIHDGGTIIIIEISTKRGWGEPIFFDHRSFRSLLEGEGCTAQQLKGRTIRYVDGVVEFLD